MRFDLVTIFPAYFDALDLSLVGKARAHDLVDIQVHNLRDWAQGRHLSVDDTPAGGGAGMVMRADVWGRAIDSLLHTDGVLAIPTPSGKPLTQRDLEWLATQGQVVIACGRYEGIDSRVAEHYRDQGRTVFEYSLGDYVLNGGEVAALALIEGTARLVEGVVGNPESLAEESHSADGLLEYPVYTQPRVWEDKAIPAPLLSGDHAKIARWRRDQALVRTAKARPDMLERLISSEQLDRRDQEAIARAGTNPVTGKRSLTFEDVSDTPEEVSALASRTFALACPPSVTKEEIEEFVTTSLTPDNFQELADSGARILGVRDDTNNALIAYSVTEQEPPSDIAMLAVSACYLSKIYVDPTWHGTGLSGAMMEYALGDAVATWGSDKVMLGTNQQNRRAIRFYRRHGFKKVGRRVFVVGGRDHHDFVFVRDLTQLPPL